jgi:voltage-gated sodium channel
MFVTCRKIAVSHRFQNFILVVIVLNAALLGLETDRDLHSRFELFFIVANYLAQAIFVVEIVIRLLAHHPRYVKFFTNGWDLFDFTVVALSFLPDIGAFATAARIARLLRVTRLVEFSGKLRLVIDTMIRSIPSLAHVLLLLGLLIYTYGILGVHLFGHINPKRWGTLGASAWTMFQTLTFENWVAVQDEVMEHYPWAWFYFFSFILVGVFVGVNLFVAIVMNNLDEVKQEHAAERTPPPSPGDVLERMKRLKAELDGLEAVLQSWVHEKAIERVAPTVK